MVFGRKLVIQVVRAAQEAMGLTEPFCSVPMTGMPGTAEHLATEPTPQPHTGGQHQRRSSFLERTSGISRAPPTDTPLPEATTFPGTQSPAPPAPPRTDGTLRERPGQRGAARRAGPAPLPCVQRQKMVSESPGLLLVPHTSSISSFVSSDMTEDRRAGLGCQDSCPGTWGRGGFGSRNCGTRRAGMNSKTGARGQSQGRESYLHRPRLSSCVPSGSQEFPYRKCPGHFRSSFTLTPTVSGLSPEAEVGAESAAEGYGGGP